MPSSGSSIDGSYKTNNHRDPLELPTCDAGPTTPTTTAAVHHFDALALEIPSMQQLARKPFRRDPSRIKKWVLDQQMIVQHQASPEPDTPPASPDSCEPPAPSSGCHPYLAYPHLNTQRTMSSKASRIEESASECFVVVEESNDVRPGRDAFDSHRTLRSMPPPTPRTPRKSLGTGKSTPGIEGTAPALRNFHLSFATHSRKPSNTSASFTTRSPSPSRSSIFRRPATIDTQSSYTQTTSLAPSLYSPKPTRAISPEFGGLSPPDNGSSTWRLRRPTVLGHFLAPSDGQTDDANPPRPSTSSTFTHSSATFTQPSTDTLSTPPKMSWGRSHPPGSFFRSAHSLWSLPTSASHLNDPPHSTKVIARDYDSDRSSTFHPVGGRPATTLSLLGSPRRRKKRKLIISGLTHGDHSRFEAVRKWCESFGEVNQITRMQNGDLHIDFRKNEVADTVCRLNARVHIAGVGSVGLSWFTGKRP